MTPGASSTDRDVATDTSLLLNFLRIDRTEILGALRGFRFHIINHVVNEVRQEAHAARLNAALTRGYVAEFALTDLVAIVDYNKLRLNLGDGEAATIAAGARLRWVIGLDEKGRARREAVARVGRENLINTVGVLLHAVRTGLLTLDQAERIRGELAAQRCHISSPIADLLYRGGHPKR